MPIRISKNRVSLENIPLNLAAEVDVASATTTNIGAATSNNVRITGTTTITAFDSVSAGVLRFIRFAGVLTLTHNATTLILPGAANITTAAGDTALFTSLGSGNWVCVSYSPSGGLAFVASNNTFTKAQRGAIVALTDGATITPDFSTGNNFSVTLGGNRTLANPTNITAGQSGVIFISQDGTGSRTLSFGSYWKFESGGAPLLTTTASALDVLSYEVVSSTIIAAKLTADIR